MPAGELVTVPLPVPALFTVRVNVEAGRRLKVAVTEAAAFIVTTHVPVPLQPPPLQPAKVDPAAAAAERVTTVPPPKSVAHVAPQLMPAGELVTVPVPVPARFTVSVKGCAVKVATTLVLAV